MNTCPAGVQLAVMFPPDAGFNGACTTIADLSRVRLSHLYASSSKWLACHLIMRHAFERYEAHGKGNRAAKREAVCSTMSDGCLHRAMVVRQLREDKRMAALLAYDSATEARTFPTRPNPHE